MVLSAVSLVALGLSPLGCSTADDPGVVTGSGGDSTVTGAGGAQGSGGAGTGGAVSSGGSASSGGAQSGTGGAASGAGGASGGATASGGAAGSGGAASTVFTLKSPSWDAVDNDECTPQTTDMCPLYPEENTSFGDNVSPEMSWEGVPEGTKSFAIVLGDLTNGMAHWAIWDIPATTTMLPAELPSTKTLTDPAGAEQAGFSAQMSGYFGSGACGNTYEHRLYALGVEKLNPANGSTASGARTALQGSPDILGQTFVRLQSRDYCEQ
ncbi:MAG TPA: YbhB/YbcL family Raf kinase inhibitor-like protein [Polyangiaceae bacterium]|nr:YbhB/YbcL family Raf kinase inhibitor-like protein [Polyangiaceae bacterium]